MIAAWMLAATVLGLLATGAALAMERALRLLHRQGRSAWILAFLLTCAWPVIAPALRRPVDQSVQVVGTPAGMGDADGHRHADCTIAAHAGSSCTTRYAAPRRLGRHLCPVARVRHRRLLLAESACERRGAANRGRPGRPADASDRSSGVRDHPPADSPAHLVTRTRPPHA